MKWTTSAQVKRVLSSDARTIGVDAFYGLGYVLTGFLLGPAIPVNGSDVIRAPILALSFVIVYFVVRVLCPEQAESTATFYANLPRDRALAYWSHYLTLTVYILSMEILVMGGAIFRTRSLGIPTFDLSIAPLLLLPWFFGAVAIWLMYGLSGKYGKVRTLWYVVLLGVSPGIFLVASWCYVLGLKGQFIGMLLALVFMQVDGAERWKKFQIGELP